MIAQTIIVRIDENALANKTQSDKTLLMKKVFVIDDDDDVRDVIVFALQNDDFDVVAFENARIALNRLVSMGPESLPGLIVVDYLMPAMDGITFIKELRGHNHLKQIPIAMSSAMGVAPESDIAEDNFVLLPKPMELEDLIALAKTHCDS